MVEHRDVAMHRANESDFDSQTEHISHKHNILDFLKMKNSNSWPENVDEDVKSYFVCI